jgi:hypothetical protein
MPAMTRATMAGLIQEALADVCMAFTRLTGGK